MDIGPSPCRSEPLERGYNGPEAAHASARGTLADDQRVIARPRAGPAEVAGREDRLWGGQGRPVSSHLGSRAVIIPGEGAERIKACLPAIPLGDDERLGPRTVRILGRP